MNGEPGSSDLRVFVNQSLETRVFETVEIKGLLKLVSKEALWGSSNWITSLKSDMKNACLWLWSQLGSEQLGIKKYVNHFYDGVQFHGWKNLQILRMRRGRRRLLITTFAQTACRGEWERDEGSNCLPLFLLPTTMFPPISACGERGNS